MLFINVGIPLLGTIIMFLLLAMAIRHPNPKPEPVPEEPNQTGEWIVHELSRDEQIEQELHYLKENLARLESLIFPKGCNDKTRVIPTLNAEELEQLPF